MAGTRTARLKVIVDDTDAKTGLENLRRSTRYLKDELTAMDGSAKGSGKTLGEAGDAAKQLAGAAGFGGLGESAEKLVKGMQGLRGSLLPVIEGAGSLGAALGVTGLAAGAVVVGIGALGTVAYEVSGKILALTKSAIEAGARLKGVVDPETRTALKDLGEGMDTAAAGSDKFAASLGTLLSAAGAGDLARDIGGIATLLGVFAEKAAAASVGTGALKDALGFLGADPLIMNMIPNLNVNLASAAGTAATKIARFDAAAVTMGASEAMLGVNSYVYGPRVNAGIASAELEASVRTNQSQQPKISVQYVSAEGAAAAALKKQADDAKTWDAMAEHYRASMEDLTKEQDKTTAEHKKLATAAEALRKKYEAAVGMVGGVTHGSFTGGSAPSGSDILALGRAPVDSSIGQYGQYGYGQYGSHSYGMGVDYLQGTPYSDQHFNAFTGQGFTDAGASGKIPKTLTAEQITSRQNLSQVGSAISTVSTGGLAGIAGMIPGAGAVAGPIITALEIGPNKIIKQLVKETDKLISHLPQEIVDLAVKGLPMIFEEIFLKLPVEFAKAIADALNPFNGKGGHDHGEAAAAHRFASDGRTVDRVPGYLDHQRRSRAAGPAFSAADVNSGNMGGNHIHLHSVLRPHPQDLDMLARAMDETTGTRGRGVSGRG